MFLNEELDLTLVCLLAILESAVPSFLAGVSRRDAGIGLGTFPTPWFASALPAGILAVLRPLLDPSKTCPVPLCILERTILPAGHFLQCFSQVFWQECLTELDDGIGFGTFPTPWFV